MLITISRQYGAGGSAVAAMVAETLGWRVVDNEVVERVAARAGISPEEVAAREERVPSFIERLARSLAASTPELFPPDAAAPPSFEEADLVRITESVVAELAQQGRVVLVGRAAPAVIGACAECLHVKLVAPRDFRVSAARRRLGMSEEEAERLLDETDSMRARYHKQYYRRDWTDPVNYHLTLNTGSIGLHGATDLIVAWARREGWTPKSPEGGSP